jgi:hypothetical protein
MWLEEAEGGLGGGGAIDVVGGGAGGPQRPRSDRSRTHDVLPVGVTCDLSRVRTALPF